MATTITFPTSVTTNGANFANTFADDGTNTTHPSSGWGAEDDITLSSFSSLSIPAGATINGIEILGEGAGNTGTNTPHMFVSYDGEDWSSALANNSTFGKGYSTIDPAWGSSSNLWGLSWNATTAAAIQIKMDSSSVPTNKRIFFDYIKVRITYTAAGGEIAKVSNVTDENISRVVGFPNTALAKINGITDVD